MEECINNAKIKYNVNGFKSVLTKNLNMKTIQISKMQESRNQNLIEIQEQKQYYLKNKNYKLANITKTNEEAKKDKI